MSKGDVTNLGNVLPNWMASTWGTGIEVPNSDRVKRELELYKAAIRRGSHHDLGGPSGKPLAILSLLTWELSQVVQPSWPALRDAEGAFAVLASLNEPPGEFDEIPEMLASFAYAAWRHSKALGEVGRSAFWVEQHEAAFLRCSVSQERLRETFAALSAAAGQQAPLDPACELETVFALCALFSEVGNRWPDRVLVVATRCHELLRTRTHPSDAFGEQQYLLAETAVAAASASRMLGRWTEAREWLDVADRCCRGDRTLKPQLLKAAFVRLALEYGQSQDRGVIEEAPTLIDQMERLQMDASAAKVRFLEAAACLNVGLARQAVDKLETLQASGRASRDLCAWILTKLAEAKSLLGQYAEAEAVLCQATQAAVNSDQPIVVADTRAVLAQCYRDRGMLPEAIEKYREAIAGFGEVKMATQVAYLRVILSETLIATGRNEEAELEILAALPTLEGERMEPAAIAAVSLLRESIRRRKTDRKALRLLREHLPPRR